MSTLEKNPRPETGDPQYSPEVQARIESMERVAAFSEDRARDAEARGMHTVSVRERDIADEFRYLQEYEMKRDRRRQRVGRILHRLTHPLQGKQDQQ